VRSQGVDWEGLDELVEASRIPCREEVLDILRNTSEWVIRNDKVVDSRKLFQCALYFTAVFTVNCFGWQFYCKPMDGQGRLRRLLRLRGASRA